MQDIKMANNSFVYLYEGTKRAIVAYGNCDIEKGSLAIEAESGGWGVVVNVTEVRHKKLCDLTDDEAIHEGMIASDFAKYAGSNTITEITVIVFDFTDALSLPDFLYDDTQDTTAHTIP